MRASATVWLLRGNSVYIPTCIIMQTGMSSSQLNCECVTLPHRDRLLKAGRSATCTMFPLAQALRRLQRSGLRPHHPDRRAPNLLCSRLLRHSCRCCMPAARPHRLSGVHGSRKVPPADSARPARTATQALHLAALERATATQRGTLHKDTIRRSRCAHARRQRSQLHLSNFETARKEMWH